MLSVRRRGRGANGLGQTVTEFVIVMPVLFMLMIGVLDGCLVMFSVGTARYATVQGAQLAAQLGNATTADDQLLTVIRDRIGTTGIFSVTEVDIYKLNQDANGNLTPDPVSFNRYRLDGTPMIPEPWPAAARNVGNGTSDFLGVTVQFTYTWKAGFLAPLGSLRSTATHYIRLEPQSY
jgi:Flp pilus assembly protein TadG